MTLKRQLVVLATGVDSLNLAAQGSIPNTMWERLERGRDEAAATKTTVRFRCTRSGRTFGLRGFGARGYAYVLKSNDLDLMIGRSQFFPPVLIELRSDYLHRVGPRRALLETEWLLRDDVFGGPVQLRTSRVDIHADVQGWCPDVADLERFVSRAHGRAGHVEREEVEREGVYTNSRRLTGLTFGRHRMVARVYDKTAELMRSNKTWLWDVWGDDADPDQAVWRLEFQFRRALLNEFHVYEPSEVLDALQDLWRYATRRWLTFRTPVPEDSNRRRWPVDPVWREVQDIEIVPGVCGLIRRRIEEVNEERVLALMQGCLTTLAALHGWWSFDRAWASAAPLVELYMHQRGRSFLDEVRRKSDRDDDLNVEVA